MAYKDSGIKNDSNVVSIRKSERDSLTKPCIECQKLSLPWGRVGQKGDHVCGNACQQLYYKNEDQRRDELYKSIVDSEPHATRRRHQKE